MARPEPINEINTRPLGLRKKTGTSGQRTEITANYFELTSKTDWCLFEYRVDISPEETRTIVRKALLKTHKAQLPGYIFDGTVLYTSSRLKQPLELNSIRKEDKHPMNIKINLVGDLMRGDYHYFQFFNLLIRKSFEHLNLQLVGRNFYDAASKLEIREYKLDLWPGYITSIRQHEQSILMCTEISYKVMRNQTLYDIMRDCSTKPDFQVIFAKKAIGSTVLTDYNNRTYRVDDVDFESSPSSTFSMRDGTKISYATYYKQKYQITIKDLRQPLLVSKTKARDRRAGMDELLYLIPELCRSTGITDEMRSDFRLMRALADHTRIAPNVRIQKLINFNRRLQNKPEIITEFKEWNFKVSPNLVKLVGRVLDPEKVLFGHGKFVIPQNADWNFDLQANPMVSCGQLKDWIAIIPRNYVSSARVFIDAMIKSADKMGFKIVRPKVEEIQMDKPSMYNSVLTKITSTQNPQLIFCIVSNNNQERYGTIKKKLCVERAIPSQVLLARTLTQKKESMLAAVSSKVAVQMNCKIGGIPWALMIGQYIPGLMVVGFDVCHNKANRGADYGAMVASLDQNFGRYFSAVSNHSSGEELSNDLSLHLGRALLEFRRVNNNRLPSAIIIYRDGVGEGQIPFVYDYEVKQIRKKLIAIYESEEKVKLAFIIVTKRIKTRFFANERNPRPGTVVDDVVTDPLKYDFFIVSQSVNQGTVSPTSYNVIEDSTNLSADKIQLLTFKLCHMYYNFSGTVRVPAPCQYAHKLAFFVSQSLRHQPNPALERLLYFL